MCCIENLPSSGTIFLSHAHCDHMGGLIGLLLVLSPSRQTKYL
ncbi:MAG: hypothetical protein ACUVRH_07630 [Candidatus Bipolaricaulia bacterium]